MVSAVRKKRKTLALFCAPVAFGRDICHRWTGLLFSHPGTRSHWSLPAMLSSEDGKLIQNSISKTSKRGYLFYARGKEFRIAQISDILGLIVCLRNRVRIDEKI